MDKEFSRRTIFQSAVAISATGSVATLAHAGEDVMTSETKSLFKAVYLVKRKAGLTWDEYVQAQLAHTKFAHALPGLRHYVLDFYPEVDGVPRPFDTAASVYFDDNAAHDAALASAEGQAALADLSRFLETDAIMVLAGYEEMNLPINT